MIEATFAARRVGESAGAVDSTGGRVALGVAAASLSAASGRADLIRTFEETAGGVALRGVEAVDAHLADVVIDRCDDAEIEAPVAGHHAGVGHGQPRFEAQDEANVRAVDEDVFRSPDDCDRRDAVGIGHAGVEFDVRILHHAAGLAAEAPHTQGKPGREDRLEHARGRVEHEAPAAERVW